MGEGIEVKGRDGWKGETGGGRDGWKSETGGGGVDGKEKRERGR